MQIWALSENIRLLISRIDSVGLRHDISNSYLNEVNEKLDREHELKPIIEEYISSKNYKEYLKSKQEDFK
jgi:hypothetical protein